MDASSSELLSMALPAGLVVIVVVLALLAFARWYRKVDQGTALVITAPNGPPRVTFTGAIVYPFVQHAEPIHMGVQNIQVSLRGAQSPSCKDGVRVSLDASMLIRINRTEEDVLKVAQIVGCKLASDSATLDGLFSGRLIAAIETVYAALDYEDVLRQREHVRDQIICLIGMDLNGYVLDDISLSRIELVPVEMLDPNNPHDAMGIRKLTEIATAQNVKTNELRVAERLAIGRQNLEAETLIQALEQQRNETLERQRKEVEAKVPGRGT